MQHVIYILIALQAIQKYERLYGERSADWSPDYIFSELLETRSHHFEWSIKPHIHPRLYQIFFIETGIFTFYESKKPKQLEGPCIVFIPPSIFHGFEFEDKTKGRIISFSDSIADPIFNNLKISSPFFDNLQVADQFTKGLKPISFKSVMESIDDEVLNDYPTRSAMLQSQLQQLFIMLFRLWQKSQSSISERLIPISYEYFRKFQQLIRKSDIVSPVIQYANMLGITTVHLNRVCNQITGKPAGKIIQEYVLENARIYLLHTSYSISEIAFILNFEYPNYFARFFKKHTGMTPKQFRRKEGTMLSSCPFCAKNQ